MTNPSAFGNAPTGPAGGALTGTYPNPTFGNGLPWQPSDSGILVTNMDPMAASSVQIATAGTVYILKVQIRAAMTWTNIILGLTAAGVGASTGSFVGLYNSAGTLLSGSADQAANFTTAGPVAITCPLTTPQALAAGTFVWAAIITNLATTQPTFQRSPANPAAVNAGLTAATFRSAVNGTALSALPGSITPASNTATGSQPFWIGAT